MSKAYGLIIPNKNKNVHTVQSVVNSRPSIFDESDDEDEEHRKPTPIAQGLKAQDKLKQQKALEEDPTVYQYDEIFDEMDQKRKESKLSRKDLDKKPKYINRLLEAADRRKRENEQRIERQVQKEREAEGDAFHDKESFVTSAYRKKLEEMKELEEQEKREEYLESIGDVRKQGNLDGFYRHLYEQKVKYEEDKPDKAPTTSKPATQEESKPTPEKDKKGKKRSYRQRKDTNKSISEESEEEVVVKKEHLPSNLDADSDFSIDSSDSEDEKDKKVEKTVPEQTVVIKEEVTTEPKTDTSSKEVTVKEEKVEEVVEAKPKVNIWKKRTVGDVFDQALQRYFERKALRQAA